MSAAIAGLRAGFERLVPRRLPTGRALVWATYTGALFLLFLAFTFPHDLVARRVADALVAGTRWRLEYDSVSLVPWQGYRFRNLRVAPIEDDSDAWWAAEVAAFRPTISALLHRNLFPLALQGRAYGGTLSGVYSRGADSSVSLTWTGLSLPKYPQLQKLIEGTWAGDFSGELELRGADALENLEGSGKLSLKGAAITGGKVRGFTVPDLHFATGEGLLEFKKGGRLEVKALKLGGSEVDADLRGDLYLRPPIEQSVINGTMDLKPIPGAPGGIDGLLMLWNRNQRPQNNVYSFKLFGTLGQPRMR